MHKDRDNYTKKTLELLKDLHKAFPAWNLARHLATATSDYGDILLMEDKELYYALDQYATNLAMDIHGTDDIAQIIEDGLTLDALMAQPDDGYES